MDQNFIFKVADRPTLQNLQEGARLFKKEAKFLKGVVDFKSIPEANKVEICFAGRSNVGKSSLLNALTNRKSLARTSNTPGRTQEINYFEVGDLLYLVDLPGYGYAYAPLVQVNKWQNFLKSYLAGRANLRRVFILIDSRRGVNVLDEKIMELLGETGVSFQVIVTKSDKSKHQYLIDTMPLTLKILSKYTTAYPEIIITSSQKKIGIDTLRSTIAKIV